MLIFIFEIRKDCRVIDDYIFVSESDDKMDSFKEAIKRMELDPNKTIYLDDKLDGIYAANAVGIRHTVKLYQGKYQGQTAYSILLQKGIDYSKLLHPDKKTKN